MTSPEVSDRSVVSLCSDLLRINTSNPTHHERYAAEYVVAVLEEVGIPSQCFEGAPNRTSVVARLSGRDPSLPPLLLHAHLDVVPAVADEWSVDPFGGVVKDGYVWGRGAVDMKGMVAVMLAVARAYKKSGRQPHRDVILAFFADEEAGGELGAGHVIATRPDLFAGCQDAIGEVGGFSHTFSPHQRGYFVSCAEKGVLWARLLAVGRASHGSMLNEDNAVVALCEAVNRIAGHRFADEQSSVVRMFFEKVGDLLGMSGEPVESVLEKLGPIARMVGASMRDTVNPTTLSGGDKVNVVPSSASATLDGRFLPGHETDFVETLRQLAGDKVRLDTIYTGPSVSSPWGVPIVEAMEVALRREDPSASILPYMGTAFTDAKWISKLGIRCYGFFPLLLPDDLDFTALFHGVDERVPTSSLEFSMAVIGNLLDEF